MVRFAQLFAGTAGGNQFEVGFETFSVLQENVVEVSDTIGLLYSFDRAGILFVVEIGFISSESDKFLFVQDCFAGI